MIEAVIFELGAALLQLDTLDALAYGQVAAARPRTSTARACCCGRRSATTGGSRRPSPTSERSRASAATQL